MYFMKIGMHTALVTFIRCMLCVHRASAVLRNETAVDAVELFDRKSLQECEKDDNMVKLVSVPLTDTYTHITYIFTVSGRLEQIHVHALYWSAPTLSAAQQVQRRELCCSCV